MRKTKLLTGLITATTIGASLITFASCSNARKINLDEKFKDKVDMSSSTNKDGDMIIKFTFKDPTKYFYAMEKVMIGNSRIDLGQYKYEALDGELTIYKKTLKEYSGDINIWPYDLVFRPRSHDWMTQGSFTPTIQPKKDFECDTDEFNNKYLADVYQNPEIIIQDWFKGMDFIYDRWSDLKTFSTTIQYLAINKTQKNNADYYTLDLYLTTQIDGVSDTIGSASGKWTLILHNVELFAKTGQPASWNICPYTYTDNDDWFIYLNVTGFNQSEDVDTYLYNESLDQDKTDFFTKYLLEDPTYVATGVVGYNSNYYRKVDAVTKTFKITKDVVPSGFNIDVPDTITNKNTTLNVKIIPDDPTQQYIPKIKILKSDGVQILQSWEGNEILQGEYTYRFKTTGRYKVTEDIIVKFELQNYVPATYTMDSSLQADWSFPEENPKFVITDPSTLENQFQIASADSLKDNLYKIQWHVLDQDGTEVYKPAENKEFLKEPGKLASNAINASFTKPGTEITSLKFEVTGITQEAYHKVTYGDLPEHFEWKADPQSFIYKNSSNYWEIKNVKFYCSDEEYEKWYTPITIAIKNASGEQIGSTVETEKPYEESSTRALNISGPWEDSGPGDIKVEVLPFVEKVTYKVTLPKLPGHWSWLRLRALRIYEESGKWNIPKEDLRLVIRGGFDVEETEDAYDIKIWATNEAGETVGNVLEFHKDHDMMFVIPNEDLTGTWEGTKGPGQIYLNTKFTKTN